MYSQIDLIRQDRSKMYLDYTIEELMELFKEIKKRKYKDEDE